MRAFLEQLQPADAWCAPVFPRTQVLLIVNIATGNKQSKEQLDELAALQEKYGPQGLQVLLFPR